MNNMRENPLLHARHVFNNKQLGGCLLLKKLKHFEVILTIFEFSQL